MTRNILMGCAIAALLCGTAAAQEYRDSYYGPYTHYDASGTETVIVRPGYDTLEKYQVTGRVNGEVNPTAYSMSRPVDVSGLDPARPTDYIEIRERIRATARDLCYQMDERVPALRGDESADRECIRQATRNAMRDMIDPFG
ncbi:MAG TPA: UrcA family protein [Rhizomicrobium sp.]|nr:UrcA family protein [Rhizomicrobium sp.]